MYKRQGQDTQSDLAVIQIDAENLTPATFGDSNNLQVGERLVVIGNAAGRLAGTVTQGILSGLDRQISVQMSDGTVAVSYTHLDVYKRQCQI